MDILVLGGTRFFGKHLVEALIEKGHQVTIATRGLAKDPFGERVNRMIIERTNPENLKQSFLGAHYDVIYDSLAYCSQDVKYILDVVNCDKYIMTSSTAVYNKHIDTKENEFDPLQKELVWCTRNDFLYDECKRQAECALRQKYPQVSAVAVRLPFVIGKDDYTQRLSFYIEHMMKEIPMCIDNIDNQMSFVRSDEAGTFLAFLADEAYCGAINGSSEQTISIKEISDYVKVKTGKSIILTSTGDKAPYNSENEYSINIDQAKSLGFMFTPLKEWIFDLVDYYIQQFIK
ncbi:NAD-dependent epimerase/dehydratase family protein [Paludicola sp. MB14-C6]|uniref:NAD-dependent epimerase/dehydratase family protein n=1 Tax=Paludihabitans sp. MB14-C6 TaxID=3070656 RepID=UPI0027DB3476|nr:NAD-dependent epimerase/dehydratase family protein [Paludicola sp. MB14-C6]WMJ22094.1 NAD-dependent epimerase/dehydratase family protein [Paludicola sp. MB14-C6]